MAFGSTRPSTSPSPTWPRSSPSSRIPKVYWVSKVIYGAGEAVQPSEYTPIGDVDEFRVAVDLKRMFTADKLANLSTWGAS